MLDKRRSRKLIIFWLLPFISGGLAETGYLVTNRVLDVGIKNNNQNDRSSKLSEQLTDKVVGYEEVINKPNQEINNKLDGQSKETDNAYGSGTINSNTSKTNSSTTSIESNINKEDLSERKSLTNTQLLIPKPKSNIDQKIFKKLFDTLPKL